MDKNSGRVAMGHRKEALLCHSAAKSCVVAKSEK
jgi:hypothetical protein